MVGGGPGSGIGPAHRYGASMDGAFTLVAGVFSRDPDKNAQMGESLGLNPERVYADFETMAKAESKLTDGISAVSIVTPNDSHVPACLAFINQGIHIICDKPLATSLDDAATAYSAAKFAVKGFTEALINDLRVNAPHVKVSVVMPGHVGTSIAINSLAVLGRPAPKEMTAEDLRPLRERLEQAGIPGDARKLPTKATTVASIPSAHV